MPPIFGILKTDGSSPDKGMLLNMRNAATYLIPRDNHSYEWENGSIHISCLVDRTRPQYFTEKGEWVLISDATLYQRSNTETGFGESLTDCQWILEAWLKWDRNCVKFLKGDFAFIVFNKRTFEIFCARDNLGIRPLFYSYSDNSFFFSSELRIIKAAFPKKVISRPYLYGVLTGAKSEKNQTPFSEIFRLMPGHRLSIGDNKITETAFWKPEIQKNIKFKDEAGYINLLRQRLINAVESRCLPNDRLGCELSGGLDSSSILGIASKYLATYDKSITSFSNVLPDADSLNQDEREYISLMTSYAGCRSVQINNLKWNISDLLSYSIQIHGCYTELRYNVYNRSLFEAASNEKISVLLSGFGGDDIVSAGILMPWEELIKEGQWRILLDELYYDGVNYRSIYRTLKVLFHFIINAIVPFYIRKGHFSNGRIRKLFKMLPLRKNYSEFDLIKEKFYGQYRFKRKRLLIQRQRARILDKGLPLRLEYCYAAAAQYGFEYRYPLLDPDLIETVLSFPPWIKLHHGIKRYAFRQAIRDFVPEIIRLRNDKSGDTIPQMNRYFIQEKSNILKLFREANSSILNEIIDYSELEKWYSAIVNNDSNHKILNEGLFRNYLMILYYYTCHEIQS